MINFLKKIRFLYFYTLLILGILILNLFYPKTINLDKNSLFLIVLLFFISILPSLQSGKISYLFEFKRSLKKAKESVEEMKRKNGAGDKRKIEEEKEEFEKQTKGDVCLTVGVIRKRIAHRLKEIQKKKMPNSKEKDPINIAEELKDNKIITPELYRAIIELLFLCKPKGSLAELNKNDTKDLIDTSLPVLEKLNEL